MIPVRACQPTPPPNSKHEEFSGKSKEGVMIGSFGYSGKKSKISLILSCGFGLKATSWAYLSAVMEEHDDHSR